MAGLIVAAVVATAALFGLATFIFAYTIEDELLARDVAAEVLALQQPAHPALARITGATTDMTHTLDLLLALAREGEMPARTPVPVRPLVDKALADAALRWPKAGMQPVMDVPADLAVPVHAGTLQLVLNNLIGNAFQHAGGSRLWIRADAAGLTIRDEGPGIGDVDAALQAFVQQGPSGGSGLGLAIVARLCASSGIGFCVAAGPGTRLMLSWPESDRADRAP